MRTLLMTFGIIFVAELPDKTALAALVLGTRYRARDVVLGVWMAFLVQTVVALGAASVLALLPERPIRLAAAAGFLVFAALAWRRADREDREVDKPDARGLPAWLTSFLVVFAAEWGDLTQLATAALAIQTREPLPVGLGALAALWTVTVLAVALGKQLDRRFSAGILNRASAVLLLIIGTAGVLAAVRA